jgi:hypothetical protein
MESSARGVNAGEASPGSGDGQAESSRPALGGLADKVRAVAGEKLGPDAGERLRTVAGEKLKAGGDRLPPAAGDHVRTVAGAIGGGPPGAAAPTPPFEERPELYVGAAFVGGLFLAGFIRVIGR